MPPPRFIRSYEGPELRGFADRILFFVSRAATYYIRENLLPHVARLVDIYRLKRDAMLKGLRVVLEGTDVEISKPAGGFFIWIKLPTGTKIGGARYRPRVAAAARRIPLAHRSSTDFQSR